MALPKDYEDESGIDFHHRFLRGGGGIPLPPKPKNPAPRPPSSSGGSGGSSSGGAGSTGTRSGGRGASSQSGGVSSYQQLLNQQKAEQRKAQNKAARRYVADAEALRGQANALLPLLGRTPGGRSRPESHKGQGHPFRKGDKNKHDQGRHKADPNAPALDRPDKDSARLPVSQTRERNLMDERNTKLANQQRAYRTQDDLLLEQFDERLHTLEQSAEDNEVAADSQTGAALANRARERANAVSEVFLQGGGESDLLRAQQMALRNYEANQQEVNRNYRDSLSSINASRADLTADTKTARLSALGQFNSDRELIWNNFYDAKAEAETQLGNTYGQMAEYYGLANEQVGRKKYRRRQRRLTKRSDAAFMDAAHTAAQAWSAPTDTRVAKWEGAADVEGALNNGVFASTGTELSKPEGASLRRWDT